MNILIHNPTPAEPGEHPFWGDHSFGLSLQAALEAEGHSVQQRFREQWDRSESADLLLVLRGIEAAPPPGDRIGTSALWIMSHPSAVSDEELRAHDQVFCASAWHAARLRDAGIDAHALLQCTDTRLFHDQGRDPEHLAHPFVFVGSTRGKRRWLVETAMRHHLPLRVWGRGWRAHRDRPFLVAEHWPNDLLGNLYRASYATFNDHHEDMTGYHYVNNRLFDSLACGTPVLTEPNEGLAPLAFEGVKIIEREQEFQAQIDEFIQHYPDYQAGARRDAARIASEHAFTNRAQELLSVVHRSHAVVDPA